MQVYFALKFVHVLAMAVWFANGLFMPADVQRTLAAAPGPHLEGWLARSAITKIAMKTSGPLTVLTGFLLIWEAGGFGNVPRRIHIGLALSLVAGNVSQFVTGATVVKIERLVQAGQLDAARALVPRFVKSSYVVEGLLLVTMALMVLRF